MITEIPNYMDFENLGKECLLKAFDLVYSIDNEFILPGEMSEWLSDNEISLESQYAHYSQDLRTSAIVLHQGVEALVKAEVCKTSPFLLIASPRHNWPNAPESKPKPFSELFSYSGTELFRTYAAVASKPVTQDMADFYESIRIRRNEFQHTVSNGQIYASDIVSDVLKAFTLFLGKDSWWNSYWEYCERDPAFGMYDLGSEFYGIMRHLDYAEKILTTNALSKHFMIDFSSDRSYFCPICNFELLQEVSEKGSKWAFLNPTKESIVCVCCRKESNIDKKKCRQPSCKGEYFSDDGLCLTCFEEDDEEKNGKV